jgi:cytochrome c-type biogenesis protein CcmH/NrfG
VEPDDAKTWFLLAQARKELGNLTGSQQAIGRALELKPGNPDLVSFQQSLKETPKP